MKSFEDRLQELSERADAGTITVGEALIGRYYRLLDGEYANRVIIKARDQIDGKEIVRFANGLTWCFAEKIAAVRCESTCPTFPEARHAVNHVWWYPDGSDKPMHEEW